MSGGPGGCHGQRSRAAGRGNAGQDGRAADRQAAGRQVAGRQVAGRQVRGKGKRQGPGIAGPREKNQVPEQGWPAPDAEDSSGDKTPEEFFIPGKGRGRPGQTRADRQCGRRKDRPAGSAGAGVPPGSSTGEADGELSRPGRAAEESRSGGRQGKPGSEARFRLPEGGLQGLLPLRDGRPGVLKMILNS